MGPLAPVVDAFGPLALLLLPIAGIAGLLAADRFLRWPHWVVVGVMLPDLPGFLDATVSTLRNIEYGAIPMLGPVETALTVLLPLFAVVRPNRRPAPSTLLLPAITFFLTMLVLDVLLAGTFSQTPALAALTLAALWVAPRIDVDVVVRTCQVVVGATLLASLATWLVGAPGAAAPYTGYVPGLSVRVSGILIHANHLGPLAVSWFVLDQIRPVPRRLRAPMLVTAGGLLLMSQSKTAWALFAFVMLARSLARQSARQQVVAMIAAGMVAMLVMLAGSFELTDVVDEDTATALTTLTGRTDVWVAGLQEWQDTNVLFGAGGDVFKRYAARTGKEWAGQAHNQFIQSAAAYGLLGILTLLWYASRLLRVGWQLAPGTNNASIGLVAMLVLGSMTETPLDSLGRAHIIPLMTLVALHAEHLRQATTRSRSADASVQLQEAVDHRPGPELVPGPLPPPGGRRLPST